MRELVKPPKKGIGTERRRLGRGHLAQWHFLFLGLMKRLFWTILTQTTICFLAAAYESKAILLVLIKHLLPLKHYHGTQIVEPALFIRLLTSVRQQVALMDSREMEQRQGNKRL